MIPFLVSTAIAAGLVLLQSNVLHLLAIAGAIPDLALIVLVFVSNKNGPMVGQLTGFASGLVYDFLSLAPLGFHSFARTVIGALYGKSRGNIFVDPILVPMLLVVVATVVKGVLGALLSAVFLLDDVAGRVFSVAFLVEIGLNAFFAPFVFGLLKLIKPLAPKLGTELRDGSA